MFRLFVFISALVLSITFSTSGWAEQAVGQPYDNNDPQPQISQTMQPVTTSSAPPPQYAPPVRQPYQPPQPTSYGGFDPLIQPFVFTVEAVGAFFEGLGHMVTGKQVPRGWERQ